MKAYRFFSILAAFLIFISIGLSPVSAQTYRFNVENSTSDIYIREDGSAMVEYTYVFANDPSADPLEFIDLGLPTNSYSLSNASGEINGSPITNIEKSPYVSPGIAFGLGSNAIPPGSRGTVTLRVENIGDVVYKTDAVQDVQEAYASFQFSPNSFGSDFVRGSTDMTVTLHLPPNMVDHEPRWFTPQGWPGDEQPQSGYDSQDRIFYQWHTENGNSAKQYIFGAAFPARLVPASVLLNEPVVNLPSGSSSYDWICPTIFGIGFVSIWILIGLGNYNADKKRRMQYLPPKIAVEGMGIKRGLTAVEAAVLLEQPLDKIITMILFSVVKKGAVKVTRKDPLEIEVLKKDLSNLTLYERNFITSMQATNKASVRKGLQDMMVDLVKSLSEKMRGFSRKETIEYYQEILKRAWQQVTIAGTPEVQMAAFDEAAEWTMLDERYEQRSREVYGPRTIFLPTWWRNYDPTFAGGGAPLSSGGGGLARPAQPSVGVPSQVGSTPGSSSLPTLPGSEFAASVAGGIQNFSSNVLGDLGSFTSRVTQTTNPPPVPKRTGSSGGGGGRSCACACACAGCACACAGGGR